MGLNKATGNMYDWVTHTHCHLRGTCPHGCEYCYARRGRGRRHYEGAPRLVEAELHTRYPAGATVFLGHMFDYFADGVPYAWIKKIMTHVNEYPMTRFAFQTRNTHRLLDWLCLIPRGSIIGTTVESDLWFPCMGASPMPSERLCCLDKVGLQGYETFVTVEPIMDHTRELARMIIAAQPDKVYVGADSKKCGLREPLADDVADLLALLRGAGIEARAKPNLARIAPAAAEGGGL